MNTLSNVWIMLNMPISNTDHLFMVTISPIFLLALKLPEHMICYSSPSKHQFSTSSGSNKQYLKHSYRCFGDIPNFLHYLDSGNLFTSNMRCTILDSTWATSCSTCVSMTDLFNLCFKLEFYTSLFKWQYFAVLWLNNAPLHIYTFPYLLNGSRRCIWVKH